MKFFHCDLIEKESKREVGFYQVVASSKKAATNQAQKVFEKGLREDGEFIDDYEIKVEQV